MKFVALGWVDRAGRDDIGEDYTRGNDTHRSISPCTTERLPRPDAYSKNYYSRKLFPWLECSVGGTPTIIKRVLVAVAVAFGLRFNFNPWLTGGNGPECAPPVSVFSAVHGNTTTHEGGDVFESPLYFVA
jgi:hypothetical protein